MNYLYDILLNFNYKLYEIYDWNKNDFLIHIRKIPFFKVKSSDLFNILNNKVVFGDEFLVSVYKKTEYFNKNKINNLDYAFLITDGKELVAFKYNNGVLNYSKLLYEEEIEALEYSESMKFSSIDYEIISKLNIDNFKTRNEVSIKNYIFKQLKRLVENDDEDKLSYLYLECFNKRLSGDINKEIYIELENRWDDVYLKVYDFLKKTLQRY